MNNSNVLSYDTFLLAKLRNEVREQLELNLQYITETREFIERSRLAKLQFKYFSACTFDYLYNPISCSIIPQTEVAEEASPAILFFEKALLEK